jgi:hypothetical protein
MGRKMKETLRDVKRERGTLRGREEVQEAYAEFTEDAEEDEVSGGNGR